MEGEGRETGYYFGNYGTGSFNWLITIYRGRIPVWGSNERTLPTIVHEYSIDPRPLSLSCIPRCQPDRATVPTEHGSFFPRMKLILRDVGAQTSTRTSVQDSFSGYTPRHFRSLPLSLSFFFSFISKGYKKRP